ncbi:MAG: hypothetical protein P8X42_10335 [Calditrichaceae bacterium]
MKVVELEKRIKLLEEKFEKSELDKILNEAEQTAEKKETKQSKEFKSGQRSLQAINPEISVTGDAFGLYLLNSDQFNEEMRSGANFRVLGLHIQSSLDPFSLAKVALEFTPNGFGLGEAYLTWINLFPGINITAGKFRQQFGVVNRWHEHALDQFDFPLALTTILGEEGLNQTGLSMDWNMHALIANANSFTLQITNGQNDHLFAGSMYSFPALLGHFKNYYDLTKNTYLEVGITGMSGKNNIRGYEDDNKIIEDTRYTVVGGLDLTVFWEPLNQALYHSLLWRSEFYYADKDEPVGGSIRAYGGYSYLEYKLSERWQAGVRLDYTQPFVLDNDNMYVYQVVPYITWWQSHWVKLRLQFNYADGKNTVIPDNVLRFQIVWAAGPHKHDRY